MEEELPGNTNTGQRKVKFSPKVPSRRNPRPFDPKSEILPDVEAAQTRELLRRVNEGSGRRGPKVERKTSVQVAFSHSGTSTSMRSYGGSSKRSSGSRPQDLAASDGAPSDGPITNTPDEMKKKKEYAEPWDYYSNYPVILPLRRPYSGDPELDLMEENEETSMFLLQLPALLPLVKRSASAKGKEIAGSSSSLKPSTSIVPPEKGCSLEELPPGFMGKMLVCRSGAIKLKLGDNLYDISPGSDCVFAQDVAAINPEEKHCCVVGELNKRIIITPDVNSLLNSVIDLA
ncbi:RNA polymerase III Rpc4 [Macleaya cordata]|uniref:RNA polymerase III Rpc4 n=1 Tax=Macleaya cordata TaxID=56857 RepID=A0A200Q634_MACCD|nr:RNA polymerase III Rpc4 [Macleaya cordata]